MEMLYPREKRIVSKGPRALEEAISDLKKSNPPFSRRRVAQVLLHYADEPGRAEAIKKVGGDISLLPSDQGMDEHTLHDVATVLREIVMSKDDLEKLKEAVPKIRERFDEGMSKLGLSPASWSEQSNSWIYQGVAEKRLFKKHDEKAKGQKAPIPQADPFDETEEARHELELVGDARLGWEARRQSWTLKSTGRTMEFQFNKAAVLDKLNKTDSTYAKIEKLLVRPYSKTDVAATDIKNNPLELIKANFSLRELQQLGELLRQNISATEQQKSPVPATSSAESSSGPKKETKEKKDPWEGYNYQIGDQILYRRPTGEWSVGILEEEPEQMTKGRRKFKIKNNEIKATTGKVGGEVEEYITDAPPRFYEEVPAGTVHIGTKEYQKTNLRFGDNRAEYDLEEVGGDKKIKSVDADVVRTALDAHRLAGEIERVTQDLKARVDQGVTAYTTKLGTTLAELSLRAKEIEKLFGSASRVNKLLPESVLEVRQRITQIQKEFTANVGSLNRDIAGIEEQAREVREATERKMQADRLTHDVEERLKYLAMIDEIKGVEKADEKNRRLVAYAELAKRPGFELIQAELEERLKKVPSYESKLLDTDDSNTLNAGKKIVDEVSERSDKKQVELDKLNTLKTEFEKVSKEIETANDLIKAKEEDSEKIKQEIERMESLQKNDPEKQLEKITAELDGAIKEQSEVQDLSSKNEQSIERVKQEKERLEKLAQKLQDESANIERTRTELEKKELLLRNFQNKSYSLIEAGENLEAVRLRLASLKWQREGGKSIDQVRREEWAEKDNLFLKEMESVRLTEEVKESDKKQLRDDGRKYRKEAIDLTHPDLHPDDAFLKKITVVLNEAVQSNNFEKVRRIVEYLKERKNKMGEGVAALAVRSPELSNLYEGKKQKEEIIFDEALLNWLRNTGIKNGTAADYLKVCQEGLANDSAGKDALEKDIEQKESELKTLNDKRKKSLNDKKNITSLTEEIAEKRGILSQYDESTVRLKRFVDLLGQEGVDEKLRMIDQEVENSLKFDEQIQNTEQLVQELLKQQAQYLDDINADQPEGGKFGTVEDAQRYQQKIEQEVNALKNKLENFGVKDGEQISLDETQAQLTQASEELEGLLRFSEEYKQKKNELEQSINNLQKIKDQLSSANSVKIEEHIAHQKKLFEEASQSITDNKSILQKAEEYKRQLDQQFSELQITDVDALKNKIDEVNKELGALRAEVEARLRIIKDEEAELSKNSARRVKQFQGRILSEITGAWSEVKINALPRLDIDEQRQQIRELTDEMEKTIKKISSASPARHSLEIRLAALRQKTEALPEGEPALERALSDLWTNDIRALQVDVFARDFEAGHSYEKREGRVELSIDTLAELMSQRADRLPAIMSDILDTTLVAEDYQDPASSKKYKRVKLDRASADRMAGIFDGIPAPDSRLLSQAGIRDWDDFLTSWKETYAPQITMHLQESARLMVYLETKRALNREPLPENSEPEPEEELSNWQKFKNIFSRKKTGSGKPAITEKMIAQKRAEVIQRLKSRLAPDKLPQVFGVWLKASFSQINTEFRIAQSESVAEAGAIVGLAGLSSESAEAVFAQARSLAAEENGLQYRLIRSVESSDVELLVGLSESEYTDAEQQINNLLNVAETSLRTLGRLQSRRVGASYEIKVQAAETAREILQPVVESLKNILHRDTSADRKLVAMGNGNTYLRDQISAVLAEASSYIPVEVATKTEEEVKKIDAKFRAGVQTVTQTTKKIVDQDKTGTLKKVAESISSSAPESSDEDSDEGDSDDKKPAIPPPQKPQKPKNRFGFLPKATIVAGLLASIPVGYLERDLSKGVKSDRSGTAQSRLHSSSEGGFSPKKESKDDKEKSEEEGQSRLLNSDRVVYDRGNIDQHQGPILPSVYRRGQLFSPRSEIVGQKFPEQIKKLSEKLGIFAYSSVPDNKDAKEFRAEELSRIGKGLERFLSSFTKDGDIKPEAKDRVEALFSQIDTSGPDASLLKMLEEWPLSIETIDYETKDPRTGLLLYVQGSTKQQIARDIRTRLMDDLKKSDYYKQFEHRNKKGEISHRVPESFYVPIIENELKKKLPGATSNDVKNWTAFFLGMFKAESDFKSWSLSPAQDENNDTVKGIGPGQTHADILYENYVEVDKSIPVPNPMIPEIGTAISIDELFRDIKKFNGNIILGICQYNAGNAHADSVKGNIDAIKNLVDKDGNHLETDTHIRKVLWNQNWYLTHGFDSHPPSIPDEASKVKLSEYYDWLKKQTGAYAVNTSK